MSAFACAHCGAPYTPGADWYLTRAGTPARYCAPCRRDQMRTYNRTHRPTLNAARSRHRQRHPERDQARKAVERAVRRGELVRPERCSCCGKRGRIEFHHPDYSRPLDGVWLRRACHRRIERTQKRRAA